MPIEWRLIFPTHPIQTMFPLYALLAIVIVLVTIALIGSEKQDSTHRKPRGGYRPGRPRRSRPQWMPREAAPPPPPPPTAEELRREKRAEARGKAGEKKLLRILRKGLDEDRYEVLHGIMIPNAFGETTEIDFIVVSEFGVFVIEAKNYFGEITVQEGDLPWLHRPAENIQNELRNPLFQNEGHVRALEAVTGIPRNVMIPLVAFSDKVEFQPFVPTGVCYFREIIAVIESNTKPLVKAGQVPEIVDALLAWDKSITPEQRAEHVARLRARKERRKRA